jgi:hypothetical protein
MIKHNQFELFITRLREVILTSKYIVGNDYMRRFIESQINKDDVNINK